ncbi:regulation of nuclear pre-mRNA domain-containing protein 1B-like [Halichondria panicea]|uniref:regulation of nuclear pre-mRNA domain-containing protein 1B-like n=1 Tax=Halichondria panicea TaxID=6063 RepID=UPI00312B7B88
MASAPSSFSAAALEKKLKDLNSSLQSIQGVSQWLIHYRRNAKTIVNVWYKELQKAAVSRKLTLLYLANDIIQNSRKKGQEYHTHFSKIMPRALQQIAKSKDASVLHSVERIISVWEERQIFDPAIIIRFKAVLASGSMQPSRRTKSESDVKQSVARRRTESQGSSSEDQPPNGRKPPEPEALIKKMLEVDGENSVMGDMATREKIASIPPEIHDPNVLTKIKDKATLEELAEKVEEASKVLQEYITRLDAELQERNDIQELLDAFIWQQKSLLKTAKKNLKDHQSKLESISNVREELKSHLANLPDLSKLPMGKMKSLEPLPSVGDLFN